MYIKSSRVQICRVIALFVILVVLVFPYYLEWEMMEFHQTLQNIEILKMNIYKRDYDLGANSVRGIVLCNSQWILFVHR